MAAGGSFQSHPRTRLKSQLEKIQQARAKVAQLAAVRDAAYAAAADESQAQAALNGIAIAEQADVQRWIDDGGHGSAPSPRNDERIQAQARLAQARAIHAARDRAWTETEPRFNASVAELERLAKERSQLVGEVLLEVAKEFTTDYCDHVRQAMLCERRLAAIRRECFAQGAQAAGAEITRLLALGNRGTFDERLISRADVQAAENQVKGFVDVLQANAFAELEDGAL